MAMQITNQAQISFSYGAATGTAASNIATTNLQGPLHAGKSSLGDTYRENGEVTYILTVTNAAQSALTDIEIIDNLGTYTPAGMAAPVTPLTYTGPAQLYVDGVFTSTLTPDVTDSSLSFFLPTLAAGSAALIVYRTQANAYAPLAVGSTIVNTATLQAASLAEVLTVSDTVTVENYANMSIVKDMSPDPVLGGQPITYRFTLYNRGNTPAESVVLSDLFSPAPTITRVQVNGTDVSPVDLSYAQGLLVLPREGSNLSITVPAASYVRSPATGQIMPVPGTTSILVEGTL